MGEAKRKRLLQSQQGASSLAEADDVDDVLFSADGFRAASLPFREKVTRHPGADTAVEEGRKDKGGMVASAVNLAFSVELYLKALRIQYKCPPRRHHRLDDLYADLPSGVRASIERKYSVVAAKGRLGYAESLGMSITHHTAPDEERARTHDNPKDKSLPAVLLRSRNVFEVWRYLYEQKEPGKVKRLLYEFHALNAVAEALRDRVVHRMRGR